MKDFDRVSPNVAEAAELLSFGVPVAIPTETVYGLAANAFDEKAVSKIFELKNRPFFNPLIVHLHADHDLDEVAVDIPEIARVLAKRFWPGPLTLVLKRSGRIPDIVTAGKSTVALRVPDHPITQMLLERLNFPLAAPSANPFGSISPTRSSHVDLMFGPELKFILEGGSCTYGIESTIIGFEDDEPEIYRLGAISKEEIETVCGPLKLKNSAAIPLAPGMLDRHYSPRTPAFLVGAPSEWIGQLSACKVAYLLFSEPLEGVDDQHQYILSHQRIEKTAMRHLYAALHDLDSKNYDIIICERFPESNIGQSINDRLTRACGSETNLKEVIERK
jgi:L-threonylcarbamoyladenylate synthase